MTVRVDSGRLVDAPLTVVGDCPSCGAETTWQANGDGFAVDVPHRLSSGCQECGDDGFLFTLTVSASVVVDAPPGTVARSGRRPSVNNRYAVDICCRGIEYGESLADLVYAAEGANEYGGHIAEGFWLLTDAGVWEPIDTAAVQAAYREAGQTETMAADNAGSRAWRVMLDGPTGPDEWSDHQTEREALATAERFDPPLRWAVCHVDDQADYAWRTN